MKRIILQIFFIVLALFNFFYAVCFPWFLRYFMLRVTGSRVGTDSCIQRVRFFGFGKLKVGKNVIINSGCYLDNRRGIEVGDYVVIAHDTKIYTLGHDFNDVSFATRGKPVIIQDYVVIFSNVLIMPGVTVGKGAVILPGAVISKDVEEMAVMGGNPARKLKTREILHTKKDVYKYWFST